MTRLTEILPDADRIDLRQAFITLGGGPTYRELALVAHLLREAEIEVDYGDELVELAVSCGSSHFVALDLATAVAYGVEALYTGHPRGGYQDAVPT